MKRFLFHSYQVSFCIFFFLVVISSYNLFLHIVCRHFDKKRGEKTPKPETTPLVKSAKVALGKSKIITFLSKISLSVCKYAEWYKSTTPLSHRWIKTQQTSIEWVTNFTYICWSLEFLDICLIPKQCSPSIAVQSSHAEHVSLLEVFSFSLLLLLSLLSLLWTHPILVLFLKLYNLNIKILAGSLRSNIDTFPFHLKTPFLAYAKIICSVPTTKPYWQLWLFCHQNLLFDLLSHW